MLSKEDYPAKIVERKLIEKFEEAIFQPKSVLQAKKAIKKISLKTDSQAQDLKR